MRARRLPLAAAAVLAIPAPAASQAASQAAPQVALHAAPGSAEALMADVTVLAADSLEGRGAGTPGGEKARRYLMQRLQGMGFVVAQDTFPLRRRGQDEGGEPRTGVNLVVTVPGTTFPDRWIVLTAHYDHVGVRNGQVFNGADDNASGTAAVLALAEMLRAAPPGHSVLVALLDAEEGGLQGARHLVANPAVPLDRILVNVNLDMVGHSDGELWVTGTYPYPALKPLVEAVEPAPPVFLRFGHDTPEDRGSDNWVSASDHGAFHREGIPFLYFGVADHPDYHRPTDDADTLNPAFLAGATETVRRVLAHLDGALDGARPES
jgi:Zn-dependent M28 family amino/carboxypeptidase